MARSAAFAVAALTGLLLAGCSSGPFSQTGVSLPNDTGVQTVSDAADSLDAHRSSASENAKAAIVATDAFGSLVREIVTHERAVGNLNRLGSRSVQRVTTRSSLRTENTEVASFGRNTGMHTGFTLRSSVALSTIGAKSVLSGSELVMRPSFGNVNDYCQSYAGYSVAGIPSLDETFGWQSGAFTGGSRTIDDRGFATWSAYASGDVVQASIGALSIARSAAGATCPMAAPPLTLNGTGAKTTFSIPIAVTFRRGELWSLSVSDARLSNGTTLYAAASATHQPLYVGGIIRNGRIKVATFRTDATGNGTLTITSTGAQYAIVDWVVASI
jgi:outer membrane murein-binding lipoprotein Lpp